MRACVCACVHAYSRSARRTLPSSSHPTLRPSVRSFLRPLLPQLSRASQGKARQAKQGELEQARERAYSMQFTSYDMYIARNIVTHACYAWQNCGGGCQEQSTTSREPCNSRVPSLVPRFLRRFRQPPFPHQQKAIAQSTGTAESERDRGSTGYSTMFRNRLPTEQRKQRNYYGVVTV